MRGWAAAALLLLAGLASSQAIDGEKRLLVLDKVRQVLTDTAFVPGVSFDKWTSFIEARNTEFNSADDKRKLVMLLNRTLREFGVSHISVGFSRKPPSSGGQALQGAPQQEPTPPELEWVDDRTVRLRLRSFGESYSRTAVEKAFTEAAGAEAMIVDLRGNGGGAVSNLQHFLSLLLPAKTEVGTMVSRRIALAYQDATRGDATNGLEIAKWTDRKFRTSKLMIEPFRGRVAVLTSRASASASEICAAALREASNAPIVGAPTAGAVLVSRIVPLIEGLEMKVPTADYYTAKYRRLEGNPLTPDAEENTRDTQACVKKALELLSAKR